MITIKLDQALDEEMYEGFSSLVIGGVDFGKKITKTHPGITQKNHKEYIRAFYETHGDALNVSIHELQLSIGGTSADFFAAIRALFKEDFSQTEYTGALSIFDCNPRFVDKKLFQFFYLRDLLGKLEVTYHEVLHFIFFDYCERYCADVVKGRSVNGGAFWELSELVNVIVLNQPAFQKILKRPELLFYPSLAGALPEIEKLWNEHEGDIPRFVRESLRTLDDQSVTEY